MTKTRHTKRKQKQSSEDKRKAHIFKALQRMKELEEIEKRNRENGKETLQDQ